MADVNADEHGSLVGHGVWELHLVEIAADLGVDLPEDVGGLAHVEGSPVAAGDHLRRNLVHRAHLLHHLVVGLPVEDADGNLWVPEACTLTLHHVVEEGALQLCLVVLPLQLDEVRLLNSNLKHGAGVTERLVDLVGHFKVANRRR